MHEVLVTRLGGLSLPRESAVRLNDRPDMTLDVYRGRKATIQYNTIQYWEVNNKAKITDPGRDISFPIFIRKEIETRKLERKSKQKISRKSLKQYKIEWKLKQEKQNEN